MYQPENKRLKGLHKSENETREIIGKKSGLTSPPPYTVFENNFLPYLEAWISEPL